MYIVGNTEIIFNSNKLICLEMMILHFTLIFTQASDVIVNHVVM